MAIFCQKNMVVVVVTAAMFISMFLLAAGQFGRAVPAARLDVVTPACTPNSISSPDMAVSAAKVVKYLVQYTSTVSTYQLRYNVDTKGSTSYGYAYCTSSTVNDCYSCLVGLVAELQNECLNANQAQVYTDYCYLTYGPNPV
ncbi:hypothetical protein LINGRAHAP2_LOCUS8451 [Linum grandiflorum]